MTKREKTAYEAGQARKRRQREWLAKDEKNQRLLNWYHGQGEFSDVPAFNDGRQETVFKSHPKCWGMFANKFNLEMSQKLDERGALTDKQTAAAISNMEKHLAQFEAREVIEQERHDKAVENSAYVGTVGERKELTLTISRAVEFRGHWGLVFMFILLDDEGRTFIYKGGAIGALDMSRKHKAGESLVKIIATIKAHNEKDGVKQTVLSRPKILTQQKGGHNA